jgi:hypothetical protein
MNEFLQRSVEMLLGRTTGPLTLRLIIQPSIATLLAIRAGLKDARLGRTPYLWTLVQASSERGSLLREGWKQTWKVFTMAIVLDAVYEIKVFRRIYPLQCVIVAVVLAIVPYLAVRGVTTRLARRRLASRAAGAPPASGR